MEPVEGVIAVRSESQAMDWSLVLVSQDIETYIERSPDDGRVFLRVNPPDLLRAIAAIRQYERENRWRRWHQPIRGTGLMLDWRVLFCLAPLLVLFFLTDVVGCDSLKAAGVMDSAAVRQGEWWRVFTAVTLHADAGHLASNLATGILLLGLAMGSYGAGLGLLASFLAGAGGNLAGLFLIHGPHRSLGASGMVLGALGMLTVHSLKLWRADRSHRRLMGQALAAGFLLLVLLGLNPHTDVVAHVGGFLTGALLGFLIALLPQPWTRLRWVQSTAAWTCLAIVALAWWRALR